MYVYKFIYNNEIHILETGLRKIHIRKKITLKRRNDEEILDNKPLFLAYKLLI